MTGTKIEQGKVTVKLPFIQLEGTILRKDENIKAAWELYVELITRVAVIDPGNNKGIMRETLISLYSIFRTSRRIMRKYGPDLAKPEDEKYYSLGLIIIAMLNKALRPFLTVWHPLLDEYESTKEKKTSRKEHEDKWELKEKFDDEAKQLRDNINVYADLLAGIAGIDPIHGKSQFLIE